MSPHLVFSSIITSFQFLFQVGTFKRSNRLATFQMQFFTVLNLATGIPSTAADHVCWQRSNLFLLANLWDLWEYQHHKYILGFYMLKADNPGVVRDATLMCFHTQTLSQRREEGCQPSLVPYQFLFLRNPSIQELILKFHSVIFSVLRA